MAPKRLGPLPRMKWAALGRGCGREGSGAAVISTGVNDSVKAVIPPPPGAESSHDVWPSLLASSALGLPDGSP